MLNKNKIKERFLDGGLKKSSSQSYANTISTVINKLADGNFSVLEDKTDKWFSEEEFNKKFSHLKPTTKRNYISGIVGWMKLNKDVDSDLFKTLSSERDDLNSVYERIVKKGDKTEYEKSQWVDAHELSDIFENKILPVLKRYNLDSSNRKPFNVEEFEDKDISNIQDFVITGFYLYGFFDPESNFGILRNDLADLIYLPLKSVKTKISDDENKNYFVTYPKSGKLVLRDYKTFKYHGETVINLPKFIFDLLKKWALFLGLKSGDVLFPDLTKMNITTVLQKMLFKFSGKRISVQMLRKIYISSRFSENKKDRDEVSNSMMHSTETQSSIYTKK